jgi:hypothetical protein
MWHAWGRKGMHTGFCLVSQKERHHHRDEDAGGWIILKWILETGLGGIGWIDLAQDRDQWKSLVNMVINLWVP